MTIQLATKIGTSPIAANDEVHLVLAADPTIVQFAPGSTYTQPFVPGNSNISYGNIPVLTGSDGKQFENAESLVKADEHWINTHWRPALGWSYLVVCMFDFLIAPLAWSMLQAMFKGNVTSQWQPITLQGAGLYHVSMGAFLGITSFGRTKEKLAAQTSPATTQSAP